MQISTCPFSQYLPISQSKLIQVKLSGVLTGCYVNKAGFLVHKAIQIYCCHIAWKLFNASTIFCAV